MKSHTKAAAVLGRLHDGYAARCDNGRQQKQDWTDLVAAHFPPDLAADEVERPNRLLAETAGDLGLALLWIVQAALIQPGLTLIRQQPGLDKQMAEELAAIGPAHCGALAHSEAAAHPLVVSPTPTGEVKLSGTKKYITGGQGADFLLVTGRAAGEEKVSRMIWLPAAAIRDHEIRALDLNALRTIAHGRLVLEDKKTAGHYLLPLSASQTRRYLAAWGIIERGLILESFLGLMVYLNRQRAVQLENPLSRGEKMLKGLIAEQGAAVNEMIGEARSGHRVQWRSADPLRLRETVQTILGTDETDTPEDPALAQRLADLCFIRSLWLAS